MRSIPRYRASPNTEHPRTRSIPRFGSIPRCRASPGAGPSPPCAGHSPAHAGSPPLWGRPLPTRDHPQTPSPPGITPQTPSPGGIAPGPAGCASRGRALRAGGPGGSALRASRPVQGGSKGKQRFAAMIPLDGRVRSCRWAARGCRDTGVRLGCARGWAPRLGTGGCSFRCPWGWGLGDAPSGVPGAGDQKMLPQVCPGLGKGRCSFRCTRGWGPGLGTIRCSLRCPWGWGPGDAPSGVPKAGDRSWGPRDALSGVPKAEDQGMLPQCPPARGSPGLMTSSLPCPVSLCTPRCPSLMEHQGLDIEVW